MTQGDQLGASRSIVGWEELWVDWRRTDPFYKHLGDKIDKIGCGGTKNREESQRVPKC